MENKQQLEAARLLLQTVEDVFPKQRRASAALQHKIAMITWHRQFKYPEPLPGNLYDVLLYLTTSLFLFR